MKINPKLATVIQREFIKIVRRKSFWLSTLAIPAFVLLAAVIGAIAGADIEETVQEQLEDADGIVVVDKANIINEATLPEPLRLSDDKQQALDDFYQEEIDALIVVPADVETEPQLTVYEQDQGILINSNLEQLAIDIVRENVAAEVDDEAVTALLLGDVEVDVQRFEGAEPAPDLREQLGEYAAPGLLTALYFLLILVSANYFIMSVTEEKENRVIEMVFTAIKPTMLLMGKIIGITGLAGLQLLINGVFIGSIFLLFQEQVPAELLDIHLQIDVLQLAISSFYLVAGFLLLAVTMVAVGSIMPSAQEAGSLTSVFLILAISPLWFFTAILANPSGAIAVGASYFPYTAPLVLLLRNTLGELSMLEVGLSIGVLSIYVVIAGYLAVIFFKRGAMEYNQRLSLRRALKRSNR